MTAQTHIVTGLPGNGKTLYTIHTVELLRKSSGRHHVYYHGIDIDPAKLPQWVPLDDPRDWHKCPISSIFFKNFLLSNFSLFRKTFTYIPAKQRAKLEGCFTSFITVKAF